MKRSKMSGGGSAGNTVVALNQFGGKSFYSCLVAKDELGEFFLKDLKEKWSGYKSYPRSMPRRS
jgi:sugar/nucleoside kinase (ribokinase family)